MLAVTSMDPLLISARAGEQQIAEFAIGQIADAELATGQQAQQRTPHFTLADAATRVRLRLSRGPQPGLQPVRGSNRNGPSPHPHPRPALRAHGVGRNVRQMVASLYSVNATTRQSSTPPKAISADLAGSWVSGLEGDVTPITVGQASVKDGLTVNPVAAEEVEQISAEERLNQ